MKQDNQEVAKKLAFVNSVSENSYTNEIIARELLNILDNKYSNEVKNFYKTDDLTLESIAKARSWIVSGGEPDIERTSVYILKDFREGKLGRFILDDVSEE